MTAQYTIVIGSCWFVFLQLIVNLVDMNDNYPTFPLSQYIVQGIAETVAVGTDIIQGLPALKVVIHFGAYINIYVNNVEKGALCEPRELYNMACSISRPEIIRGDQTVFLRLFCVAVFLCCG